MSRRLPLLTIFACAALAAPGCLHRDQDFVAASIAQELAAIPRDTHAQTLLNIPKPKVESKEQPPVKGQPDKLNLPPGLPGVNAPPIVIPPLDPKKLQDPARDKAIQALYPELPPLEEESKPAPGPNGQPLDLPSLQQMALANNPLVRQAAADVQAACGGAIQAGLYPNPTVGLQWDSLGQAGTIGQPGAYFEQTIKTACKLELARAAGMMDVRNANLALRRTQMDVMGQVRSSYFAVLVAHENLVISRAMASLADNAYRLQVQLVKGSQSAPYEALQLHIFAVQARGTVFQARNRYMSAWRQLAAALGQPELPPTMLAGFAEAIPPGYDYEAVRAHMLANHTDMGIANNGILKSRILVQLAKASPIPDINTHLYVQKDHTAEPNRVQAGIQIGVDIPVWNLSQGTILQAQAQLARANGDIGRVENDLTQRLADAYERYRNSITFAAYYRESILPSQVRVYRAIHLRFQQQPGQVQYNDIVVAQQTLAQALQTYVQTLAAQWQAIVDLSALAQTDDIYQLTIPVAQVSAPQAQVAHLLDTRAWTTAANSPRISEPSAPPQQPPAFLPRAILAQPTVLPAGLR